MIQALEGGGTDHSTIVATPPNNHPIELLDEVFLASCLIRSNDRAELRIVPFDRRATGFDESLEVMFGIVPAHRILADLEAQEVKSRFAPLW